MSTTWKAVERRLARMLGGRRVGCTGKDTPDVIGDWWVAEIKHRSRPYPQWLTSALAQVVKHGNGKLPFVVFHEKGKHDDIVVMRRSDFCKWFIEENISCNPKSVIATA